MTRTVIEGDAVTWCLDNPGIGPVITSPPDAAEVDMAIPDWLEWFPRAVDACLVAAWGSPAVFYVTDRRHGGETISKAGIILKMALVSRGHEILWHKIATRSPELGNIDFRRPGYSHMICIGSGNARPGKPTADVFFRGPVFYRNGMGIAAARLAVAYAAMPGLPIVNPFCGRGTVLAAADELGIDSIGIDNEVSQCAYSRTASLPPQIIHPRGVRRR